MAFWLGKGGNELNFVRYSDSGPFSYRTPFKHSITGLVYFSDPHCVLRVEGFFFIECSEGDNDKS